MPDSKKSEKWLYSTLDHRLLDYVATGQINKTDFYVYCVLLRYADKETAECFPGNGLMKQWGVSKSTMAESISVLEELGLLKRLNHKFQHKRKIKLLLRVIFKNNKPILTKIDPSKNLIADTRQQIVSKQKQAKVENDDECPF